MTANLAKLERHPANTTSWTIILIGALLFVVNIAFLGVPTLVGAVFEQKVTEVWVEKQNIELISNADKRRKSAQDSLSKANELKAESQRLFAELKVLLDSDIDKDNRLRVRELAKVIKSLDAETADLEKKACLLEVEALGIDLQAEQEVLEDINSFLAENSESVPDLEIRKKRLFLTEKVAELEARKSGLASGCEETPGA